MGLLLTTVAGLVAWVVLWALGVSGFDGFLVVVVLVLVAVAGSNIRALNSASERQPTRASSMGGAGKEDAESRETSGHIKLLWTVAVGLVLLGLGTWLWSVAISNDLATRLSDFGSALFGGAVVAVAVLLLQLRLDKQADLQRQRFEEHARRERQAFEAALEAQSLRLVVGLQGNLSKADLSDANLARSVFNAKELTEAIFLRTDLTEAVFVDATLTRAVFLHATLIKAKFVKADLTDAVFSFADLKGAEFFGANVTNAVFTDALNISPADFRGAYYCDNKPPTFDDAMPNVIESRP